MEEKFFDELKEKVKGTLGEIGSHDFSHTERVYKYSLLISKGLDVDLDIVKASAILHDIGKHIERKGEIKDHAAYGAIEARKILEKTDFPKEKIEIVCKCIVLHNKKEDLPNIKEVRVLKEADGLEAVGAMGIARVFSYIGEGLPWDVSSPKSPSNLLTKRSSPDYFRLPIAKELSKNKIKIANNFCDAFAKEYNLEI
jgi:putative nucleotidyltransferase with HDIG domain